MKKVYATGVIITEEDATLVSYVKILKSLNKELKTQFEKIGCAAIDAGCKEVKENVLKTIMASVRNHIKMDNLIGFVKDEFTGNTLIMVFDEKADVSDNRVFEMMQDSDGCYIKID